MTDQKWRSPTGHPIASHETDRMIETPAPQGWKLVPIEPTADMINAAELATSDYILNYIEKYKINDTSPDYLTYKAMLSAAPTPAPTEKVDLDDLHRLAKFAHSTDDNIPFHHTGTINMLEARIERALAQQQPDAELLAASKRLIQVLTDMFFDGAITRNSNNLSYAKKKLKEAIARAQLKRQLQSEKPIGDKNDG